MSEESRRGETTSPVAVAVALVRASRLVGRCGGEREHCGRRRSLTTRGGFFFFFFLFDTLKHTI